MPMLPDAPLRMNNDNINRLQPMPFVFPGKPAAGAVLHQQITEYSTIPQNLVPANDLGTSVAGVIPGIWANTAPTSTAVFTLNYIRPSVSNTPVALGTLTLTAATHSTVAVSSISSIKLLPGDVLQVVAPATQDATMADIAVTISTYAT